MIGKRELLPGLDPEPVEVFCGADPPLLPGVCLSVCLEGIVNLLS